MELWQARDFSPVAKIESIGTQRYILAWGLVRTMSAVQNLVKRAISLHQQGNVGEAEVIYGEALKIDPKDFDALHMLGIIHAQRNSLEEAERLLREALSIDNKVVPCLHNYGTILCKLNRFDEAIESYDSAIKLAPNHAPIYSDRGHALYELKRYGEALANYDKALALKPNLEPALVGRGNVFHDLRRYDNSIAAYNKALTLRPNLANAWLGLGNVFNRLKRYEEAFVAFDKAIAVDPDLVGAAGFRLLAKMHLCDWKNFDAECDQLIASVREGKNKAPPFSLLAIPSSANDQLQCAKMWVARRYPPTQRPAWRGKHYKHDRIRVAYLSGDFCEHPTAFLMAGLFECHDKSQFEVLAVSTGPNDNSEIRQRLKASSERFIDAEPYSVDQIADVIQRSEVDILVDLMGFASDSRTGVFAQRSAPLQVNYLGYPGTMGASYIDYIIADQTVIPDKHKTFYSEKIVLLPNSYQPNDRNFISEKVFNRSDEGLPSEGFVFCCFNNNYKIVPRVFDSWMRILRQVDGSALWLFENNASAVNNLKSEAVARGVGSERLIFARRLPLPEHLARQKLADLFLDTLPYNAHTTARDALWAGLPVLTQIGETFAGRVAASLLNAVELPELVTQTQRQYEELAVTLAKNPEKLTGTKKKLLQYRLTKPLFDTQLYTRHIEAAYTAMHLRYQAGLPPDNIQTSP